MSTAVDKDLLNTGIGEELKGVFNEWGICEW